jgi:hypothetical protein
MAGYVYEESTSGAAIDVSLLTCERVAQEVLRKKKSKYLFYDMNTHGKTVTATVYIDGTAQSPTIPITTTARERGRIEDIPELWEGYRYAVGLSCSDITDDDLEIYSPLSLDLTPVGS